MNDGWIGVDLDGTLAHYDEFRGPTHIGDPIPEMVDRVRQWLGEGKDVRIFTARASGKDADLTVRAIQAWCLRHLGESLPVTCEKDHEMLELWDDRVRQVEKNTGRLVAGQAQLRITAVRRLS